MFRENIEKIVKNNPSVKFINATEGGANIEGTEVVTLKKAISKYEPKEKVKKNILLVKTLSDEERRIVVDEFNKSIEYLMEIKVRCSELVKLNKKLKKAFNEDDFEEYDIISKKMDKLEGEVKELYSKVDYIKTLVYPIIVRVEINDEWVWKIKEDDKKKFEKFYNKTKFLYSNMKEKVDYAIKFIERYRKINE